jgi:RNA recognition motif-containing protein
MEDGVQHAAPEAGSREAAFTLYVGNLHQTSNEEELAALFAPLIPVQVKIMKDKASGKRVLSQKSVVSRERARDRPSLTDKCHRLAWYTLMNILERM